MTDHKPINGEGPAYTPGTLDAARNQFCDALIDSIRNPDGSVPINPMELLVNSYIDGIRISALADALTAAGILDPADIAARTTQKLQEQTARFQAQRRRVIAPPGRG